MTQDLAAAVGVAVGGRAMPAEFSVSTYYTWHNHECFHLYSSLLGPPTMFFSEGMAVAHEFDPYNNDWVARHNRGVPSEPYIDMVLRWRAQGRLYPMEPLLESEAFASLSQSDPDKQAYRQTGMFISYLIERFGLERMKDVFRQVQWRDSVETVMATFMSIYGVNFRQAETDWLAYLDGRNAGRPGTR